MALINTHPNRPNPAANAVGTIRNSARSLYDQCKNAYLATYKQVWQNPHVTPEQIVAELGTDAGQLFQLSEKLVELLAIAGAEKTDIPFTVPTGYSYTINDNGTVNLAKAEVVPPAPQAPATPAS